MRGHQRYVVVGEGEKWQVVGLMGFLGTAGKLQSSFLPNMKWAQHNILKPDKSNVLIICITAIDYYRYLTAAAGAKGVMKHSLFPETHGHTPSFRWEFILKWAICEPLLLDLPRCSCDNGKKVSENMWHGRLERTKTNWRHTRKRKGCIFKWVREGESAILCYLKIWRENPTVKTDAREQRASFALASNCNWFYILKMADRIQTFVNFGRDDDFICSNWHISLWRSY